MFNPLSTLFVRCIFSEKIRNHITEWKISKSKNSLMYAQLNHCLSFLDWYEFILGKGISTVHSRWLIKKNNCLGTSAELNVIISRYLRVIYVRTWPFTDRLLLRSYSAPPSTRVNVSLRHVTCRWCNRQIAIKGTSCCTLGSRRHRARRSCVYDMQ